ncbi:SDR family NAD(P)-dependent oxidoreductase [Diaphorobacter caeni]|uniref:SDR family NAD(P)-dependent oxidoreductase n=1 Tax=Diaphorobacter caeni TaxID=2784387 RepID=UPI00188F35E3|nr:SDR family NAD(P)-dependent oxidoreductase [Diaphorobacter caeni]MBF5002647.1 SDR family NAD(P)-dependent oxidoreductase [Diaphorobacter caeni]
MKLQKGMTAIVTGGVSGLGEATAISLLERGLNVVAVDLNEERGAAMQQRYAGQLTFVRADVADGDQMQAAIAAAEAFGEFRALVHCAGVGGPVRLVEKDGSPGSLEKYTHIVRINLIGTFNTLRLSAAAMAKNAPIDGERGVCVLTASVAGYEGQIGQIPYASAKAGIIGMTLVAARDLATKMIRVCTIAPGLFDTPILAKLPEDIRQSLAASVPNPPRLGKPHEYALTALHILENPMLNGETIRLDGAIRMQPR